MTGKKKNERYRIRTVISPPLGENDRANNWYTYSSCCHLHPCSDWDFSRYGLKRIVSTSALLLLSSQSAADHLLDPSDSIPQFMVLHLAAHQIFCRLDGQSFNCLWERGGHQAGWNSNTLSSPPRGLLYLVSRESFFCKSTLPFWLD